MPLHAVDEPLWLPALRALASGGCEEAIDVQGVCVDALAEIKWLRKAIKLQQGIHTDTPWSEVSESDVDNWIAIAKAAKVE